VERLLDNGTTKNLFYCERNGQLAFNQGAYLTPAPPQLIAILDDAYGSIAPVPLTSIFAEVGAKDGHVEEDPAATQLEYGMGQLMQETGLDRDLLDRWVRAFERKGQAIIYGPPGTGKTFVAERLGRHIVGGTDGFLNAEFQHVADPLAVRNSNDATIYYLYFASHKPVATKIIDDIFRNFRPHAS
jgi:hypothetical protein